MNRKTKTTIMLVASIIAGVLAMGASLVALHLRSDDPHYTADYRDRAFHHWLYQHYGKFEEDANRCLLQGDTAAYYRLFGQKRELDEETTLYYAFLMVDSYKYIPACHDVYEAMCPYYLDLDSVDVANRRRAVYYLKLGASQGDSKCQESLRFELTRGLELRTGFIFI